MSRVTRAGIVACTLFGFALAGAVSGAEQLPPPTPITLSDLFSETDTRDVAIAPGGRYLAVVTRQGAHDVVWVEDLEAGTRAIPVSIDRAGAGEQLEMRISHVAWKNDERLLFRVQVRPKHDVNVVKMLNKPSTMLGDRLFAINRDGSKSQRLLSDVGFLGGGALNLGEIASMLPKDPDHVLMVVNGFFGPTLFRVNIQDGKGELVEMAVTNAIAWWFDVDGEPIVRVMRSYGTLRFQRKQGGEWQEFHRVPVKAWLRRPEYEPVGASNEPGKYYVLARPPDRERTGVYLYDLTKENFGEPVVENPTYDIFSAAVSRDGSRLVSHCYVVHVRVCEVADPLANLHMKGLREYFKEAANIQVVDVSRDSGTLVLNVEGPAVPPSWYYYRVATKHIEFIGFERHSLFNKIMPVAAPVTWKARDGRELSGYLTRPAAAPASEKLPLVVLPHGGPELRDRLTFDPQAQYLAARGFAVFQPNFRGSDGFGRTFAESGYGEWGRAMQDDITDGLESLVQQGVVDPARVCIVGASYGGYAALAGVALTPDLYKCAVSIAGVSDLSAFVKWYKSEHGADSASYGYWRRAIGDPGKVLPRLRAVSPVHLADQIKADVLLIHGSEDYVVPIAQSKAMKRALDNSRRKIELIELEGEGHSYWSDENEMLALEKVHAFLVKSLGPGFSTANLPEAHHAQ